MAVGTVVFSYKKFYELEIHAFEMAGLYELTGEYKIAKALTKGVEALTKCVQSGKLIFMYIDFPQLPGLDYYKINNDIVLYFYEYDIEGKVLGTSKINKLQVFRLIGFNGSSWLEFADWLSTFNNLLANTEIKEIKCKKCKSVYTTELRKLRFKIQNKTIETLVNLTKCDCGYTFESILQVAQILSKYGFSSEELANKLIDLLNIDKKVARRVLKYVSNLQNGN